MNNFRFKAIEFTLSRQPQKVNYPSYKVSEYFGANTFNNKAMQEYLSKDTINNLKNAIEKGTKIDSSLANQVATGLKEWAVSKEVTHYTHWFQPLTGTSAEKHDAFISSIVDGKAMEDFKGTNLIQQEPDASSFPSGGIRNTFEARGYTAWDPTSPAFIIDKTLCIPTIFVSYTGEALDYKTPLLKALNAVDKAAVAVCQYFDKNVTKTIATLGIEQEYFLVDSALCNARPDLLLTGRTLFGHASAKDQQLEDHYFGTIPDRVVAFMKEFEYEAHLLGIPVKTRHNEVAPNQFECAPLFEEANLAIDHNQILMDLMEKVAKRHNFVLLLHEKPYAGVNGSGKHNNWSIQTNTGVNLLSPGKDSKTNLQFLTFLVNIIKAVNDNAELLRASIASASNDHRLGANEAPPAIISVFVGTQLTKTLENLEKKEKITHEIEKEISISIPKIPEILLDNTDRNRTSPFAFTGNKFEFRAVGSSANCAAAMIALNTIIADQLIKFRNDVELLIAKKIPKEDALMQVIKRYNKESKNVRFEGNNYSAEWLVEAKKRGLSNVLDTPHALKSFVSPKTIKLFSDNNILSKRELEARHEIKLENYIKKIQIEARIMGDLAINHIIPVAIKYQNVLLENVKGMKIVVSASEYKKLAAGQIQAIKDISEHMIQITENVNKMIEERKICNHIENAEKKAIAYNKKVLPFFESIRYHVDKLEFLIDDELWPLPKYRELLFSK